MITPDAKRTAGAGESPAGVLSLGIGRDSRRGGQGPTGAARVAPCARQRPPQHGHRPRRLRGATIILISFTGRPAGPRDDLPLAAGRPPRRSPWPTFAASLAGVIVDWLPFYLILVAYDFLRGFVGSAPALRPALPAADPDRRVPLRDRSRPSRSRTASTRSGSCPGTTSTPGPTYLTHYFTVFVVAAILWRVARPRFLEFRAMVVTLSLSAFATYALVPAAPPWMASDYGLIDSPVYRVTGSVWTELGVHPAAAIWDKGDSLYNPVAALPSLHAAFPMLLLCFFWRDGIWLRLAGIVYVLSMAWTLVYGGEHYVFDVFLGWIYAVAVYFGVRWVRAKVGGPPRRCRRGARAPLPAPA